MHMKITITIPEEVYKKLEVDRGLIPRSTYIQDLVTRGGSNAIQPRVKVSDVTVAKEVEESKVFAGDGDTYLS